MVSVAHAEDSSSANANTGISILHIERASAGVLTVQPVEGPSFLVREVYVAEPLRTSLAPGVHLDGEQAAALISSARSFLAERQAMALLARAEQCRFLLDRKLERKGYAPKERSLALDYLESMKYLDDSRFCEAWLRNRGIHRHEGAIRLVCELRSRGIERHIAESAVAAFGLTVSELEQCCIAREKLVKRGKEGKKLLDALIRKGFSSRTIRECLKKK
ncbi:MAG: RecX family transcriptional regulator [Spirochaetales bacterium]|nr:RecX family transcriptional regulator [Spirochaetales bacterium]